MYGMGQYVWYTKYLISLESRTEAFAKRLVDVFDDYCDSALYTVESYLTFQTVKGAQRLRVLSVLSSSRYQYSIMPIKKTYQRNLKRRRTIMIETVGVMNRRYKEALSWEETWMMK